MKLLSVVGTRPNYLKELALQRAAAGKDIEWVLADTGQHYHYNQRNNIQHRNFSSAKSATGRKLWQNYSLR